MGKRTCICNLCSCGRHRCPHLPTKIYDKTEKTRLLSEYTENYPIYQSYLPRNSFKPEWCYRKPSAPMEGLTTCRITARLNTRECTTGREKPLNVEKQVVKFKQFLYRIK
uniref:Stabilizer of axonemal microtubules 1 n=1 Tax=Mus musculus TaxID=10090 RepID=Q8C5Z0_MOUSE|nr:unnamed protein product [Mus musculus]